MAKHTPGPWKITEIEDREGGSPFYRITAASTLFLDVAECSDGYVPGQNEANARLIAAAPDLLDQLKQTLLILRWKDPEIVKTAGYQIAQAAVTLAEPEPKSTP